MLKLNSKAPGFILKDQKGKARNLDDYKGKKILLSFRPLAWTPI